ncbi:DUF5675 family protein [Morganella psychrotolerans]|uniref:DUF5675 family protein n=1 Tax=Morganella psychrotolerans TaxID=368603 RepID=UPI0039AF4B56
MSKHVLSIVRETQSNNATISSFAISGSSVRGYILERPGPDTSESMRRKRIPEGRYFLKWHNSTLPGVKKYNPVPLLFSSSVSPNRGILIHNGNYPANTDGCLLVGASRGIDFVGNSVVKLKEIKTFLDKAGIQNVTVNIRSFYTE